MQGCHAFMLLQAPHSPPLLVSPKVPPFLSPKRFPQVPSCVTPYPTHPRGSYPTTPSTHPAQPPPPPLCPPSPQLSDDLLGAPRYSCCLPDASCHALADELRLRLGDYLKMA